jgi:hypothetical protein
VAQIRADVDRDREMLKNIQPQFGQGVR